MQRTCSFFTHYNQCRYNQCRGTTNLIEIFIALLIIGVISIVAIPSLNVFMEKVSVQARTAELMSSLTHARNHAINHARIVHVCQLDEGRNEERNIECSDDRDFRASWSAGWLTFVDVNNNGAYDIGDQLLRINESETATNVVFNQRGRLRFFPDGSARSAGFYVCDINGTHHRHVLLLYTGRTRSQETANGTQRAICEANSGSAAS